MKLENKLFLLVGLGLVSCSGDEEQPVDEVKSPAVTTVFDYFPAVGQHVNKMPEYTDGDTQETMNAKALKALQNNEPVTLGGYGGYIVVGFDHTIENVPGRRDFRVMGNAFYAQHSKPGDFLGGSCEPGIIMVAYDKNKNGEPDEEEWFEIAGSAHVNASDEPWFEMAQAAGNDVNFYTDYEITYYRPTLESNGEETMEKYIKWEDSKGNSGYRAKNSFHSQSYYPAWINEDRIKFSGSRLPQNGIGTKGEEQNFVLYKFNFGYADNAINAKNDACIDIDWAVDRNGRKVNLPGADFIKIYTGVNQENGWIGECSTEVAGVVDLHVLGEEIGL